MYEFSAQGFDYQTAYDIIQQIAHIKRTAPEHMAKSEVGTAVLLSSGLNAYLENRQALRAWSEAVSGKVPARWGEGQWYDVTSDLERADVELTPDMIDAALRYPSPHVLLSVAQNRLLSADQMQYVRGLELSSSIREDIDAAQQRLAENA